MKLNFRILWIDDDRSKDEEKPDLERKRQSISEYLETNFFIVDSKTITIENGSIDIDENFPYKSEDYDLFLVDFNIGTKQGFEYINRIRGNSLHTEIIFYSKTSIEDHVKAYCNSNNFLEGVFLSSRGDLVTRFETILDMIDKKVNNLNTMRGMVLAETADLDYILCEIIDKLCDKYSISKTKYPLRDVTNMILSKQISYICSDASTSEKFINWIHSKSGGGNYDLINHLTKPTSRGLSVHTNTIHFILTQYRSFYQTKRNDLAHGKTGIDPTTGEWKANGVKYTVENLKQMRKQLLEFRQCFENFKKFLA